MSLAAGPITELGRAWKCSRAAHAARRACRRMPARRLLVSTISYRRHNKQSDMPDQRASEARHLRAVSGVDDCRLGRLPREHGGMHGLQCPIPRSRLRGHCRQTTHIGTAERRQRRARPHAHALCSDGGMFRRACACAGSVERVCKWGEAPVG